MPEGVSVWGWISEELLGNVGSDCRVLRQSYIPSSSCRNEFRLETLFPPVGRFAGIHAYVSSGCFVVTAAECITCFLQARSATVAVGNDKRTPILFDVCNPFFSHTRHYCNFSAHCSTTDTKPRIYCGGVCIAVASANAWRGSTIKCCCLGRLLLRV